VKAGAKEQDFRDRGRNDRGLPVFIDTSTTSFDLKFRLFSFPIRVHPYFWLIMALLGSWVLQKYPPFYLALWVVCAFLSVLVHELGHALAARFFGAHSSILLYGFGGVAQYSHAPRRAWQRLLIALAGPAAGFALFGLVFASDLLFDWSKFGEVLRGLFWFLFVMNLFWNLFNLLPIYPLDGGKICRELLDLLGVQRPDPPTYVISMLVAGALAAYGAASLLRVVPKEIDDAMPFRPSIMMTIFFVLFVVENYQWYQASTRRATWHD